MAMTCSSIAATCRRAVQPSRARVAGFPGTPAALHVHWHARGLATLGKPHTCGLRAKLALQSAGVHRPSPAEGLQVRTASRNGATPAGGEGEYEYDLFTIGAGSGGVRASRFAASTFGIKAAVCELPYGRVASATVGGAGGTCVLRGCVPKKLMVFGGEFAEAFRDSVGFGWDTERPGLTWQRFMENKNKELERLNGVYLRLLEGSKVDYHEGRGRIVDAHTVEVDGRRFTARNILIAVGGRPTVPPIEGAEHTITSDQVLNLDALPGKMAIVGGGYIALEFAGIYNNFGTEVHVLFRQPKPLRGFDEEVRDFVMEQYGVRGLNLHPQVSPTRIVKGPDGKLTVHADVKDGEPLVLEGCDHVLMATGRRPNTQDLGLEQVGVETDEKSGAIKVDRFSRTNVPSIWAIGDVTNRLNLTPVALMEGMAFARNVFGGDPNAAPDHSAVASAVFSSPPIATVGLTEAQAVEQYGSIDVFTSSFRPMKNTISGNPAKAMMKLLVAAATDEVVGVHMVGLDCGEIMQGFVVAVKMGVTKAQLDTVVGIHPTSAEEFVTMREPSRRIRAEQLEPVAA